MTSSSVASERATAHPRTGLAVLASYLLLGVVALLPRVLALGLFLTDDEANFWLARSDVFLKAIQSGDYAATAITAHPGVTTMWLGAGGILLRRALLGGALLHSDAFPVVLALMRLPAAVVHAIAILLGYAMLRRMFSDRLAGLAALLWAADPFVIGYSRLLHTDALAGTFMTLSVLAALLYWNHGRRLAWLAFSGIAAGLAFLSKSPALILLPSVGLVALLAQDQRPRTKDESHKSSHHPFVFRLSSFVAPLALWGALAALTVFALWPALWVSPIQAYQQVQIGIAIEGAQPHQLGNFFLGRADDAPGLLYYPVALALRTTPWTLLGLLALPLRWRGGWPALARRDFAGMAGLVVLFVLAMSLFPKKFDRYIEPAFPALDLLAAAGLLNLIDLLIAAIGRRGLHLRLAGAAAGVLAALALGNAAWWHPYDMLAFNQALGGTPAGARTFTVGWGEGLEQVADWLNQQPDITGVRTIALRVTSLRPFLRAGAQADFPKQDQLRDRTGYVVVYLPQVQAGRPDGAFAQFYGRVAPAHVVRIHGVDMAWIYRAPAQAAHARAASFGPDIRLYGFDQAGAARPGARLNYTLVWGTAATPPQNYWLFAHLVGPGNRRYAQIDLPCPTGQWAPGSFVTTELPITIPAGAPKGQYRLLVGLYDQASGQRLPVATTLPGALAADDADAFVLAQFELSE